MKVLELFAGTGSVGKICKSRGWDVVSLDLKNADINVNILDWDYKTFSKDEFDIVWASPPCNTFSVGRLCWMGKTLKDGRVMTPQLITDEMEQLGLPLLNKAREIIEYFNPRLWFIENPQTGRMKNYITDLPFYDVDYCMYGFEYKKRTRIWTNLEGFDAKICNKKCGSMIGNKHLSSIGNSKYSKPTPHLTERYAIPSRLVEGLLN
tara:strand:+ start:256 stop:876 length:621 start_codon:yes stop_codon:yes gene_type:complete